MHDYTILKIAPLLDGRFLHRSGTVAPIEHLSIDSRRLVHPATTLFFALKTERRNGHDFMQLCYEKGVRNFIVQQDVNTTLFPEAQIVQVADTLRALHQLTAHHRRQFQFPVIGITGSNGKTIVKEWLFQLLNDRYRIVRSPKSYNSQVGVPLSVWQMDAEHTLGLFEAGISEPGEMELLEQIIQPTIGVFTNLGEAHDQGFKSRQEKFLEKTKLFDHAATVVYAPEQTGGMNLAGQNRSVITWGSHTNADLQIRSIQKETTHTQIQVSWKGDVFDLEIPFTDSASLHNALTCATVCLHLEMPVSELRKKIRQLQPISLRLELKKGIRHCTLINDSYSADLSSFEIALNLLQQQRQHPNKTIILSDFPVPEHKEAETYAALARQIVTHEIQRIITVGTRAAFHLQQILPSNIRQHAYFNVETLIQQWSTLSFENEAILLKGARVFELERLIPLLEEKVHQTVLEINMSAIANNLHRIREQLQPGVQLMAMVKAFSYGSGSYEIANLLQYHGTAYLAVAFTDEGVELRRSGINLPIMVMNPEPVSFDLLVEHNLEPELYSFDILEAFRKHLEKDGIVHYPIHLKLDTGMHRLGFLNSEIDRLCQLLNQTDAFALQTVFSHLAASEDPNEDAYTQLQAQLFETACRQLKQQTGQPFLMHLNNSSGIIRHPKLQYDMVRLGIGLYGITAPGIDLSLEEALTLRSTIAQLKTLEPGTTVGYNRSGIVNRPSKIATVRIGYADGYPRLLSNGKGRMLVNGQFAPVIGNVCMDMTMLDVTDIPDVKEGDEVLVFGKELSIRELAAAAGTIPYEIMTGISQRVKRVYYEE